ncbi:phage virion morphogenesis protein [Roseomonas eburnea]|uniref:Phage virion morphogenesis protein n=1 Tax=Neoroseomonas eburnea TaxID=1346889 RepID=A0A9X9XDY4_9PROT|nr:phage virion morphogenesis protein [Neoroseomonas eburnea]MBR0681920.1 phage virion morphogenesis protein [Neoroseomonas eburnea]
MSGAHITVTVEAEQARALIGGWIATGRDPAPILRAVGARLVSNTQDRFDEEVDPDGAPWEPLTTAWAALKKGPGILRESGMRGGLQGSITFDVAGGELAVGSNKIYAAVHQFGAVIRAKRSPFLVFRTPDGQVFGRAEEVTIPARPYLGLSSRDQEDILDAVEFFLMRRP